MHKGNNYLLILSTTVGLFKNNHSSLFSDYTSIQATVVPSSSAMPVILVDILGL